MVELLAGRLRIMPATTERTEVFDPLAKPKKAGLGDIPKGSDALTEVGRLIRRCVTHVVIAKAFAPCSQQ